MSNAFLSETPFLRDVLWQTTLLLFLGVLAAFLWSRQPAKAHRVLLLAMIAAVLTPLLSHAARERGWGLFARQEAPKAEPAPAPVPADLTFTLAPAPETAPVLLAQSTRTTTMPIVAKLESAVEPVDLPAEPKEAESPSFNLGTWLMSAWALLGGLVLGRLLIAIVQGCRLLAGARPIENAHLQQALNRAMTKLGLRGEPILLASERIASPVIWCWGRRPIILLPEKPSFFEKPGFADVDWVAVLCHELAHWKRHDHWSSLMAELVVAFLPVQPLAWWARRRLAQLCERACDDWVLASGQSPVHYAESLLGLLPQQRPVLTLAAVRSKKGLKHRIRHILKKQQCNPAVSRAWTALATLMTAFLAVGLALVQERPVPAAEPLKFQVFVNDANDIEFVVQGRQPAAKPMAGIKIDGRVLSPDGKPVANAPVVLVADSQVTGKAKTDKEGRFHLEGLGSARGDTWVIASAPGFGPSWHPPVPADPKKPEITIQLTAEQVIRGRLIDLQGQPASGVKVEITRLGNSSNGNRGMYRLFTAVDVDDDDEDQPSPRAGAYPITYTTLMAMDGQKALIAGPPALRIHEPPADLPGWPKGVTTDKQGRFAIKVGQGMRVGLLVRDERFALQNLDIQPQKEKGQEVTLALSPARTVEGTVVDTETGKPLPKARVRVRAPGSYGEFFVTNGFEANSDFKGRQGMGATEFLTLALAEANGGVDELPSLDVRTDDQGRFKLSLFAADSYTIRIYGPKGEPYLPMTTGVSWQKGMARKELNIKLSRGVVLRGKVTEEAGGKPVAGARVDFWSKDLKLPDGVRYPKAATTAADGTFHKVLLPGKWHVFVNAASSVYLWEKIAAEEVTNNPPVVAPPKPGGKPEKFFFYPDHWAALELKPRAEPQNVAVRLRQLILKGQVVDPDGKPAAKAKVVLQRMLFPEHHAALRGQRQWFADVTQQAGLHVVDYENELVTQALGVAVADFDGDGHPDLFVANEKGTFRDVAIDLGFPVQPGPQSQPVQLRDGKFTLPVNDLDVTYRLLIQDVENGLGAVVDLKGQQAKGDPVTIKLAKCSSATARFVDEKGKMLANYRPLVWAMLPPVHAPSLTDLGNVGPQGPDSGFSEVWLGRADPKHYGDGPRTDAEGRITLPNLVPGVTYRISQFDGKARDFTVKPGETVPLGAVRVLKPEQTKKLPNMNKQPVAPPAKKEATPTLKLGGLIIDKTKP